MQRRQFLASSATLAAALAVRPSLARQAAPAASGFPRLEIALTDDGFELPESISAGRHEAVVTNTGTMTESHWAMGRFPDGVTDAEERLLELDGVERLSAHALRVGFITEAYGNAARSPMRPLHSFACSPGQPIACLPRTRASHTTVGERRYRRRPPRRRQELWPRSPLGAASAKLSSP